MTRINTIDPQDLVDQHLFIEFREITRIASLARALYNYGEYTLGEGHMKFFYNKGMYLTHRLKLLQDEMDKRGLWNYTPKTYKPHPDGLNEFWQPSSRAHVANLIRLDSKLREQPDFYKLNGKPVDIEHYSKLLYKYNK